MTTASVLSAPVSTSAPVAVHVGFVQTPVGAVRIEANDQGITAVSFVEDTDISMPSDHPHIQEAIRQLNEYIEGYRQDFSVPLVIDGTPFQQRVWKANARIPFGETRTYGQLTKMLDMDGGSRAVGSALGANKICIIIPCHRVLPQAGGVGGYAYGAHRKEWLLALERA